MYIFSLIVLLFAVRQSVYEKTRLQFDFITCQPQYSRNDLFLDFLHVIHIQWNVFLEVTNIGIYRKPHELKKISMQLRGGEW